MSAKIHEATAYISLIVAISCSACVPERQNSRLSQGACDVALLYTKDFKDRAGIPIAVWFAPQPFETGVPTEAEIDETLRLRPEYKNDPQLRLARSIAQMRDVSVIQQCPKLYRWWEENSAVRNDSLIHDTIDSIPPLHARGRFSMPFGVLALSAPAISADGSTALFYVAEATRTEGGRFVVTYKRVANGSWQILSKGPLGIG